MMPWLGALVLAAGFFALFHFLKISVQARAVFSEISQSAGVVRHPELDDDQKANRLQGHSKKLFALFFMILGKCLLAAGIPLACLWLLGKAGLLTLEQVFQKMLSLPFIAGLVLFWLGYLWLSRKRPNP